MVKHAKWALLAAFAIGCAQGPTTDNTEQNLEEDDPVASVCGNGVVEAGELCDDGNQILDDACCECYPNTFCGNGVIEHGEDCDSGSSQGDATCTSDCRVPTTCTTADCQPPCTDDCPPPPPPPPVDECTCKVTGGGFIYAPDATGNNRKITFGFVAMTQPDGDAHGNLQITDHPSREGRHGRVQEIDCDGNTVTFAGNLKGGGSYTLTVTDNGEPGRNDTFSYSGSDGYSASGTLADGGPGGGNIQVHKPKCD